MLTFDLAKRTK